MSKILLIKPRLLGLEWYSITHPMGLMYIGATLKSAGHEPKIHDCCSDYKNLNILRRTITDWKPDFIGISIIITEREITRKIMKIIRQILPDVSVIFGGPWPSANPEEAIQQYGADFVVLGEGELIFPELINAMNNALPTESIPGTASMVNGRVKINQGRHLTEEELNSLPFPAWELLDHELYANTPSAAIVGCKPYMTIVTSRGCPYSCSYCHQTMGKIFRKRSAQSVIDEMTELRFNHGFKEFEITEDCFNLDRERMHAILKGIKERLGDVKLHFPNGLRADILTPEDIDLFKQAGTVSAAYAIETSSPRLQKMIRKNLNIKKAMSVINASVKAGILSTGFFMIGFPTETYQEACGTVDLAARSTLHHAFFINPTPFAGTELAEMASDILKSKYSIFDPQKMNYQTSILNISAMSDTELHKAFRKALMRFYLSPRRIMRLAMVHPRILSLPRYAFGILKRLFR
jgi:anaerobic magnesium-protoporphyrin IX monomethyl ester cyclase